MKTMQDLDDALLTEAKALAAKQRTTLTRVVEEGLRMRSGAQRSARAAVARTPLPMFRGKGGFKGESIRCRTARCRRCRRSEFTLLAPEAGCAPSRATASGRRSVPTDLSGSRPASC
jgi:hypothetical protein